MTRILEIVGTDIRREIEKCSSCILDYDGQCTLTGEDTIFERRVRADCPLPEKPEEKILRRGGD
jgi:hypothetical protein